MQKIRGFSLPGWLTVIVLFVVGIITFGLLAPELGFYQDDWPKTLINVLYGFEGSIDFYGSGHPLSVWMHAFFVHLLGRNHLHWQILNIFLRVLSAIALWWSFKALWPTREREIALVSLLYLVLPIFTQQAAAVTFYQQWFQAALYFLSLGLLIRSLNTKRWYWLLTLLALLAIVLQLAITEYFCGLVLILPFFIGLYFHSRKLAGKELWKKTCLHALPYLLLSILYGLWRLESIHFQPWQTTFGMGRVILLDLLQIMAGSWAPVFDLSIKTSNQPSTLFSWALSLIVAIFVIIFFLSRKEQSEAEQTNQPNPRLWQFLLAGVIVVFTGLLPAWALGKNVLLDVHANRYALPALAGVSLIMVAVFSWFIRNWESKVVVMGLLVGLAAGFHIREMNDYRWNWKEQSDFYWQLYWRAPKIHEKTAIFFNEDPFPAQGLISTSAAINLLYANNRLSVNLPYWAYTILPHYSQTEAFPANQVIESTSHSLYFEGNTSDMILTHYNPSHGKCWWILSGDDQLNPYLSPQEREWAAASNLDLISSNPSVPLPNPHIFGEEPDHDWCYFYEKAELAVQVEDWQTVTDLGDEAQALGYQPEQSTSSNSPREWIPFILGYGKIEDFEEALDLTMKNISLDAKYQPMLCAVWDKMLPLSMDDPWREYINQTLNCTTIWENLLIDTKP